MQNNNRKISADVVITSILLALFVETKILNLIVLAANLLLAGVFMAFMYGVVLVGLFYMGLFRQRRSLAGLAPSHIGICVLCILWYMVTTTFIAPPSVTVLFFGVFTVAAILIPGIIRIDVRMFLLALVMLPSVGVFYVDQIIINSIIEEGGLSMGISYSLLIPVLANLVFLKYFFVKERKVMRIVLLPFIAINLFYLAQVVMLGSRGPVLCIFLLIVSFFLIKIEDSGQISFRKDRLAVSIVLVVFVSLLLFIQILQAISNFLAGFDITLNFVDKFLRMEDHGDMSNGRGAISSIAWDAIWKSPFWGYGIAQFENNTGIVYPHNFIIQMLYDGGIILASCIFIPIIKATLKKIHTIRREEFICLLYLFFASVPGALFSGDLWQAVILWMFFGFVLSKNSIIDN